MISMTPRPSGWAANGKGAVVQDIESDGVKARSARIWVTGRIPLSKLLYGVQKTTGSRKISPKRLHFSTIVKHRFSKSEGKMCETAMPEPLGKENIGGLLVRDGRKSVE